MALGWMDNHHVSLGRRYCAVCRDGHWNRLMVNSISKSRYWIGFDGAFGSAAVPRTTRLRLRPCGLAVEPRHDRNGPRAFWLVTRARSSSCVRFGCQNPAEHELWTPFVLFWPHDSGAEPLSDRADPGRAVLVTAGFKLCRSVG